MQKITVLVTGVAGGGLGEQIIKALRLSSIPYEIVGIDMDSRSMGLQYVDHPYVVPPASDTIYNSVINALCLKHGVKVLIPGSEPELMAISRNRDQFAKNGVVALINSHEVIKTCLDKLLTMSFLERFGFSHPQYMRICSSADLATIDYLPAVLKPASGAGGSVNTFIVQSQQELVAFGKYLLELTGGFICQEYVGTPEEEYTVGVLLGLDGKLINSIAVRRNLGSGLSRRLRIPNRTSNNELGATLVISSGISQGEIGPFPEVTGECEKLALALGCSGAVNIQCRLVNGRPCIFEINPRFSGTTSLRAMVGYNEPDVLIRRHFLNEEIQSHFKYEYGYLCRGLNDTLFKETVYPKAAELV